MRRLSIIIIALTPTLLALGIAFLFAQGILNNLMLVGEYRIDAVGLVSRGGILAGGIIVFILLTMWWAEWRAERTLQEEKKLQIKNRHRFFHRLDHELKNPLTIIKLGIVNLQQSSNMNTEQQASLNRVGQHTERLQKLVKDLRWLSELEEHRLERYPVDLVDVLEEAVSLTTHTYPARVINVNIQQVPWPVSDVSGDRDMLVIVFRNLLDNAFKYTASDDRVEVRVTDDSHWAAVEIADTGAGIPDSELSKIFEELYRGKHAQDVAGSGLGLTLVWRIVQLHDGQIDVRSRIGQGTVIIVRLKLSA